MEPAWHCFGCSIGPYPMYTARTYLIGLIYAPDQCSVNGACLMVAISRVTSLCQDLFLNVMQCQVMQPALHSQGASDVQLSSDAEALIWMPTSSSIQSDLCTRMMTSLLLFWPVLTGMRQLHLCGTRCFCQKRQANAGT